MPFIGEFQPHKLKTDQENYIPAAIDRHYFFKGVLAQPSFYQIEYLDKMGKLSAEYGFNLLLVKTPLHKGYAETIPATIDKEFYHVMAEMEKKYSNVRYVDSRDAVSDTAFFYDGDHLNGNGAMTFSTYFLKRYLSDPQLAQDTP